MAEEGMASRAPVHPARRPSPERPGCLQIQCEACGITTAMETVTTGPIMLTWDADVHLATIRFEREARATGKDAVVLVDAMTGWIGTEGNPFGLLGDGGKLSGLDAEYRSVWGSFLRRHRDDSHIAFFNMNTIVRIAAEMFRVGTGLRLKAFADEGQARTWLRENGISA